MVVQRDKEIEEKTARREHAFAEMDGKRFVKKEQEAREKEAMSLQLEHDKFTLQQAEEVRFLSRSQ